MAESPLDIDALWDWSDPAASEARFRALGDSPVAMTQVARALGLQQKFEEAHGVLDQVEPRLSAEPPEAAVRYHLERGRIFNDTERTGDAIASFTQAWERATAAGGLDPLAVDALHMLAVAHPPAESLPWHEKALAAAAASADPKARGWRATLLNNYGWTLSELGRHEEALAVLEEALQLRREAGTPGPIRIARFGVAKVKRMLGRVEEAIEEQRALMAELHGVNDDGTPVWVPTDGFGNEEIGECLLAMGQPDEARPYFVIAHDVLSKDPWLVRREPERIARLKQLADAEEVEPESDVPAPPPAPMGEGSAFDDIVDDVQPREEAHAWAWAEMRRGRDGEDVVADLVARGWDQDDAEGLVESARKSHGALDAVANAPLPPIRFRGIPGLGGRLVDFIVGIFIAIFTGGSAVKEEIARRDSPFSSGRCAKCGLDLQGSSAPCPRCGTTPPAGPLKTAEPAPPDERSARP